MTIFISDIHLGNWRCKADRLLSFLDSRSTDEKLILVGDIIDDHQLRQWPISHFYVLQKLLDFKKIIYLPGNHDHRFRKIFGNYFDGKIEICDNYLYETNNGKAYFVTHGDRYDWMMKYTHVFSERWITKVLRWCFESLHTKLTSASSAYCINIAKITKTMGYDGVICGHNHYPDILPLCGVEYMNTGDWTDNCSAIIENDGKFELVYG